MQARSGIPSVFLSLSSHDRAFVESVNEAMLKGFTRIYTESFQRGDDLIVSMERNVSKSAIFVLFISENSLDSVWVEFEIHLARLKKIRDRYFKIFLFAASPNVSIDDLPEWLREFWHPLDYVNPRSIARFLNNVIKRTFQQHRILGRGHDIDLAEQRFITHMNRHEAAPNVFMIAGIEKIGRTTFSQLFFEKIIPNAHSLCAGPVLYVSQDCDIKEFYLAIRKELEQPELLTGFEVQIAAFEALPHEEQFHEIVENFSYFAKQNEAIFIRTSRGFFNDLGKIKAWLADIFHILSNRPNIRLVLIGTRQASALDLEGFPNVMQLEVKPLADSYIQGIVDFELHSNGQKPVRLSQDILLALGGHPLFARAFAEHLIRQGELIASKLQDGVFKLQDNLLAECVSYNSRNEIELSILCILSWVPRLDGQYLLQTIEEYHKITEEDAIEVIHNLVNLSLIDFEGRYFHIARPVRLFFRRKHGFGDERLLETLAHVLQSIIYHGDGGEKANIDAIDTLIFVFVLEGKAVPPAFKKLVVPGTILSVMRDIYQHGNRTQDSDQWERVISINSIFEGINLEREARETCLGLVVRSHVRLGQFNEAKRILETFEKYNFRSRFALWGFFERYQNKYLEAIGFYEQALQERVHDMVILHELCICYYKVGNLGEIKRRLERVGSKAKENHFLLDLMIQIATVEGRFPEAERMIDQLRRFDDGYDRADRRLAIMHMKRNNDFHSAIKILDEIIDRREGGSFEFRAVRGIAAARAGRHSLAQRDLEFIKARDARSGSEIATRISIHMFLSRGDWKEALSLLDCVKHMGGADFVLKAEALELKSRDVSIPILARQEAAEQSIVLRQKYRLFSDVDFADQL